MIKEALKYLTESRVKPSDRVVEFKDQQGETRIFFVDDDGIAREVNTADRTAANALEINTLTGLINYVKANNERHDLPMFIHVKDEQEVVLSGLLDYEGRRENLVIANAITPHFSFDSYQDTETLNVALQAKFVKTDDRDVLLKVIGNLKEEDVRNTGDDGVSQAVTIQTGIASAGGVRVPNPVTLAPYRTFLEVEQPASDFVFRMRKGPAAAIFEADGGAWRNEAIANVRNYLADQLTNEIESGRITIIA